MITALIVDDESKARSALRTLLNNYCPQVKIIGEAENADGAYEIFLQNAPQLVFLDVEMPYGTGFDLLKRLPHLNFEVIFVTGFDQYALQAIKFHTLDYLLKPVEIDELTNAVQKAEVTIQKKQNTERLRQLLVNLSNPNPGSHRIAIPTTNGREFVPVEDIIYCNADGGNSWIFLKNDRKLFSSQNLETYEKLLPSTDSKQQHQFLRTHHRHLINLFYVQKYNRRDSHVLLYDGTKIAISQRRKPRFLKLVNLLNLE